MSSNLPAWTKVLQEGKSQALSVNLRRGDTSGGDSLVYILPLEERQVTSTFTTPVLVACEVRTNKRCIQAAIAKGTRWATAYGRAKKRGSPAVWLQHPWFVYECVAANVFARRNQEAQASCCLAHLTSFEELKPTEDGQSIRLLPLRH